jgi:hypothetical protein
MKFYIDIEDGHVSQVSVAVVVKISMPYAIKFIPISPY